MSIDLPPYGITVRPPWGQCIVYFGKNFENRGRMIVNEIGNYRGPILISQSGWQKQHEDESLVDWEGLARMGHVPMQRMPSEVKTWAGTAFAIADVVQVIKRFEKFENRWRVPDSAGLVLENVRRVILTPCSGTTGAWKTTYCEKCGRIASTLWTPSAKHPCEGCLPWNRKQFGKKLAEVAIIAR